MIDFDQINRLLKGASPMGAYSLGLVSALGEREGITVPATVLEAAVKCECFQDAVNLYSDCVNLRSKP